MFRGEIWLVDLEPSRGSEANKRRPCIIVSNDQANQKAVQLGRGVITVVPLTTNVAHVRGFQLLVPASVSGLRSDSKAQAEQIRAVSVDRVERRLGTLNAHLMMELGRILKIQLDLA